MPNYQRSQDRRLAGCEIVWQSPFITVSIKQKYTTSNKILLSPSRQRWRVLVDSILGYLYCRTKQWLNFFRFFNPAIFTKLTCGNDSNRLKNTEWKRAKNCIAKFILFQFYWKKNERLKRQILFTNNLYNKREQNTKLESCMKSRCKNIH